MPKLWFSGESDNYKLEDEEKASATYSSLRTGILSLTPGDQKCRLYCSGPRCRFCIVVTGQTEIQAIDGLYSTWITSDILAMARLQVEHFDSLGIVEKFKTNGIQSVINLQESGEHSFCGSGNLTSGFSYDPENLMRNGIYHYNFPLPDFQACTPNRLLDIVKVVDFALSHGKIAVHCHAGHGRTGMVIAAWMMYALGMSPSQAVDTVRSRRAKAVQSKEQVKTLHEFRLLIRNNGGMIIPKNKMTHISEYVAYNQKFISKPESRLYGKIPKIVYIAMRITLQKMYSSVNFEVENDYRMKIKCEGPLPENKSFDEQLLNAQLNDDDHEKTHFWYMDQVKNGLSISTISRQLENEDFRDIIRLLDLFFHSTFHQLTHKEEIFAVLQNWDQTEKDWSPTFWFLLKCIREMPIPLHLALSRLISKWFLRSEVEIASRIKHILSSPVTSNE
ncbi:TYR_PHOSPHATASE_2 domain-containing protein [Caenorhabditis elegans]|uniref:TYR_PHOSPHATASE_2 domain-containing protein n=1 Tax=Caenorhabditis elegans TaxID=6239 RepID=Q9UAX0_CAEEL|nr:TYR_PHOSPHATASE_2 domain-containing protein [Caenorhabditis elegans]CCD67575.1 TYR_PHOSPHATASE_2 domain-containing protein [Caenorhabditis elegans]|eukprot:NP_501178.1 Uncharacterized protein CELE_T12B3.1 [Caenorhabditis elegans]